MCDGGFQSKQTLHQLTLKIGSCSLMWCLFGLKTDTLCALHDTRFDTRETSPKPHKVILHQRFLFKVLG